jgi:putative FmdB family regulatory protein
MPTYTYMCDICETECSELFPMASRPDTVKCPECGGEAEYRIAAPGLVLKEAFLDGTKRKGWAEMKEASKLNRQMSVQPDRKDKDRIAGQIRQLGVKVRQDGKD